MKTADEDKAARVALERLATAQAKRCVVFDAARSGNPDVIKRGIYEDGVDPNGGEWLTGGREAVAEIGRLRNSGVGDQSAGTVKLSKGQKKRAKAKAKAQAQVTTEAASESTGNTTLSMSKENVVGAPKHENTSRLVNSDLDADSKETLLHICVQRNEKILVEWLLDHGAVPDERNSRGFTAAHLSILLNQVELAQHFISECPPGSPFEGASIDCGSRDPYQPPPPKHSLLSLALAGASRDVKRALELVRLVLPFVGGREIRKCWKKIGFQQGRKPRKDWEAWDDIKWALAKRAQELNFQDFTPHEPFDGPRPHVFRPQEPTTCSRRA
ncbi:uncharacterized protein JCM15063_003176 [Sporobolomyces koalae]|uniref:uncharacterized protein n=1 Tax=Sporobolomyces koalae TaxID=500713 RepID=UPI003180E07B